MKLHILHHLTDSYLAQTELKLAHRHLEAFTEMVAGLGTDAWHPVLCLSWGTYHQSSGRFDEAEKWLQGAAAGFGQGAKHFVAVVAMFNLVLLYLTKGDMNKAEVILEMLVKSDSSSEAHHAAIKALQGATAFVQGEFQGTKTQLLACIRACDVTMTSQLKTLSVSILGNLFQATDQKKSEMILNTALGLAKKTKQYGWTIVVADALAKLTKKPEFAEAAAKAKDSWKTKLTQC